jgi:hypothetical protein
MCTEKCLELARGSRVSRRKAIVGAAAVAASAALGGTAQAGEREPAFGGGRHGLRDLTHPLTTSFPPFSLARETVATIEADGYYMQKWEIILDRIPRRGATIMVGLIPYEDGSGGQARVFASW